MTKKDQILLCCQFQFFINGDKNKANVILPIQLLKPVQNPT